MHSIRRRLSLILIICSIAAVVLSAIFVNIAVDRTFNKYMSNIQDKRNKNVLEYFQQVYKNDKIWTKDSGVEMMHEAYMSNYCITLLDSNKNVVWGMNPTDIKEKTQMTMHGNGEGEYTSKTFDIKDGNSIVGYIIIGQYFPVILSQDDINFRNSINRGIAYSAVITIIIVSIIGLKLSKQFSGPIKRVSDISVDLSNGNYESKVEIKSNIRELNFLSKSMNTLGEKLKSQEDLRKKLISDISHEIRTPLNVLQNNLEAMIDGVVPISSERLVSLDDEVIRFSKLLDGLNMLKKFETNEIELLEEEIFIDELIAGVCEDFYFAAKNKNINLVYNIQNNGKYKMQGDIDKLKQVFINLISNSIKFTEMGGKVWVNLSENKNQIIVKIKDNGIGISEEDLPFIFERLYRGDKSRHEIEGNGIGLTVVKKILDMHSAIIKVDSEKSLGTEIIIFFNK